VSVKLQREKLNRIQKFQEMKNSTRSDALRELIDVGLDRRLDHVPIRTRFRSAPWHMGAAAVFGGLFFVASVVAVFFLGAAILTVVSNQSSNTFELLAAAGVLGSAGVVLFLLPALGLLHRAATIARGDHQPLRREIRNRFTNADREKA